MSFHTTNDCSIQGLNIRCKIGLKVDELNVGRDVGDGVAWEVVKSQTNMLILAVGFLIKLLNPPVWTGHWSA